jgi:hypothetical protein
VKQHLVRIGACLGAATLLGLSIGPATAAEPVTEATANALTVEVGGSGGGSGIVAARNFGTGEQKTGEANAPIDVLDPQGLINAGTLAQDAAARIQNKNGVSRACAGVAGEGASTVAEVGDSNCLTPGQPVDISFANLDLTGVHVADPEGALEPINQLTDPLIEQLVGPLTQAISRGLSEFGNVAISGTAGAIQSRCAAQPGSAEGFANIADATINAELPGQTVNVATLPVNPPPNTKVVTDLDVVVTTVLNAVRTDLNKSFDGALLGALPIVDAVQENIVDTLIAEIAPQLAPIEDNLLDITLNEQSQSNGRIAVTAVDAQVLPAAREFTGDSLVSAEIANVTCAPNRAGGPDSPDGPDGPDGPAGPDGPDAPGGPGGPGGPDVPTVVDAGANDGGINQTALIGGLLMLGGAAGLVGYRRLLGR